VSPPTPNNTSRPAGQRVTYYDLLDLKPESSSQDVRRAYWEKSKLYHPDTTTLPTATAKEKFQQLNEAYATLSNPEQRSRYDQQLQQSAVQIAQARAAAQASKTRSRSQAPSRISRLRSAYLDPGDRPLSPGEIFALFILGLTLLGCLLLALVVGLTRGEVALQTLNTSPALSSLVHNAAAPAATKDGTPSTPVPKTPKPSTPATSLPSTRLTFKLETSSAAADHEPNSPTAVRNPPVQPSPAPNRTVVERPWLRTRP
jgi:hypothetical protein